MYPISYLYKVNGYSIDAYPSTELTPEEFHQFINLNTRLYISTIYHDKIVTLDYSTLVTDHTDIATSASWEETSSNLTEALVYGHIVELPGYTAGSNIPNKQLVTWDAMNCLNTFYLTYGSYLSNMQSNYSYRWKLHDLVIEIQEAATLYPDLSKVIPVVNGVACRPRLVDNTLYAVNGARLCWHTQEHFTPEVQLLDFSALGDIKIHDLNINQPPKDNTFQINYEFETGIDWLFTSPQSLNKYTPLIVLNGHLILPDQIKVIDEYHFTLNVDALPLNKISGYRAYMESRVNGRAEIAYTSESIEVLLTTYPENNFVILVEAPTLYVKRLYVDVWNNDMIVNLRDGEGLLSHLGSGTIRVYNAERLNALSTLTIQNSIPIYLTDELAREAQTTVVEPEYQNHELDNVQASQCNMIYLMR